MSDNKLASEKFSSLPPLRLSSNTNNLKPTGISKRLELYFKLRTSSNIVINDPIECFLPSSIGINQKLPVSPTAADIVMSPKPPPEEYSQYTELKFSRLIEAPILRKKQKDNSFLNKSFKTNQVNKNRRESVNLPCKHERKKVPVSHKNNLTRVSIPFLSEAMNKACKQSSNMLFSPQNFLESGFPSELKNKYSLPHIVDTPQAEIYVKTIDNSLQNEEISTEKLRRRVIYNKNVNFSDRTQFDTENFSDSSNEN